MTITIKSPLTNKELYNFEPATDTEIAKAMNKAREDAKYVRSLSVKDRIKNIDKIRKYIVNNMEDLVDKIIGETGKSRTDALVSEIYGILEYISFAKKMARKTLKPRKVKTPISLLGKKSLIYYDPLGVVLIIEPWNYPLIQAFLGILQGYVAGNAVLYKASEHTPLKGVIEDIIGDIQGIHVLYGDGSVGEKIIKAKPDKVFFTGSTRSGKKVMATCAKQMIPLDLELGGKDPSIVFDDVNLERTVAGVLWGALTNSGQSCTSIERVYVQEGIYNDFVSKLKKEMKKLVISDAFDADLGCMTVGFQKDIVLDHIEDAKSKGAEITSFGDNDNLMIYPTILTNVVSSMKIYYDETFGPVIPIISFKDEDEAVKLANTSEYGLSASVWSKDLKRAERVAHNLEVGNVSINNHMITEGNPYLPFGGVKNSGFGRSKGVEGLLGFVNIKSVVVDKQSDKLDPNWYPYTRSKYKKFQQLIHALFNSNPLGIIKVAILGLSLESEAKKPRK